MKNVLLLSLVILAGCAPKQYHDHARTKVQRMLVELPPEPPTIVMAAVPKEYPISVVGNLIDVRIKRVGDMFYAMSGDPSASQLMIWNGNGQSRTIPLGFNPSTSEFDFAINNNTLVVSDKPWTPPGPNVVQEYALGNWSNGFPTTAVPVQSTNYSTSDGRWTRSVALASGGIFTCTLRQIGGWNLDVCYRTPSGVFKTYYYEWSPPNPEPPFNLEACQLDDGHVYVFINKDSSAVIMLGRFLEQNGGIVNTDFGVLFGQNIVDGEFPQVWILKQSGTNVIINFPTVINSVFACSPPYWRFCEWMFQNLSLQKQAGGHLISSSLNGQHLNMKWSAVAGQNYVPLASQDLVKWPKIQVVSWTESKGTIDMLGVNPFYVPGALPSTAPTFLTVDTVNYKTSELYVTVPYSERSFWRSFMVQCSDGHVRYYLQPIDFNTCTMTSTYLYDLTNPSAAPVYVDYAIEAVGEGWIMLRRGDSYYIKTL